VQHSRPGRGRVKGRVVDISAVRVSEGHGPTVWTPIHKYRSFASTAIEMQKRPIYGVDLDLIDNQVKNISKIEDSTMFSNSIIRTLIEIKNSISIQCLDNVHICWVELPFQVLLSSSSSPSVFRNRATLPSRLISLRGNCRFLGLLGPACGGWLA